ncbi:hypothetical protein KR074_006162 [Drosophila pseudoananassae]|nr:hypothetical protein KR074_006162 [Drosophila pseudoananassae]
MKLSVLFITMQLLTLKRIAVLAAEVATTLQEVYWKDPEDIPPYSTACIQNCIGNIFPPFLDVRSAECSLFERDFDCTLFCSFYGR